MDRLGSSTGKLTFANVASFTTLASKKKLLQYKYIYLYVQRSEGGREGGRREEGKGGRKGGRKGGKEGEEEGEGGRESLQEAWHWRVVLTEPTSHFKFHEPIPPTLLSFGISHDTIQETPFPACLPACLPQGIPVACAALRPLGADLAWWVRRWAGKRKDAGSTDSPLRLTFLFKNCDLWTLAS